MEIQEMEKLVRAVIDADGREINNPVPVAQNIRIDRPPTMQEQIKRVLRSEINKRALEKETETYEESIDFVMDDDEGEPLSGYEVTDMIDEAPAPSPAPPEPAPDPAEPPAEPAG